VKYDWDWSIYLGTAADASGTWVQYLIVGLGWTLATALTAWVIALVIGSVVGTLRTTPMKWVVRLGNAYVEIFRNVPLLVQMFLWFFVFPEFLPKEMGDAIKQMPPPWGSYVPAVISLGLYTSVRVAEQVRAGIQSLPRGQMMAATALGLTLPQAYRFVLLPMAFRVILPPLTSEFLNVIKNSSVALTIGLLELTGRARSMQEFSFKVFEAFAAATVIYIITNLIIVMLMRALERRVRVPGFIGSAPQGAVAGH
jgi:glutamate/aspartate transport system permease protein